MGLAVGAVTGFIAKELHFLSFVSYWGDRTLWVVLAAIIGAGLWITRFRWLVAASTLGTTLLYLLVAFTPLCLWLSHDLPRRDVLTSADAVYVLGSDIQRDGQLTTSAMSRLLHGLELLGRDLAPRLVVGELPPPVPSYAVPAKRIMRQLNLQKEVLSVGPVARTRDEAVAVGRLFREKGWRRVLLVTSPCHSRRASASFEKEGLVVISSPSVQTEFDLERLHYPDDRIRAFSTIVHEHIGWWLYRYRGWI
jgi:uncharacterized SAM-binding protein YcdF (DUF218 family)